MTAPLFDGQVVITEQPGAIRGQFLHCEPSHDRIGRHRSAGCSVREECRENQRKGGAALCEMLFVVACGGEERTL